MRCFCKICIQNKSQKEKDIVESKFLMSVNNSFNHNVIKVAAVST